MLFTVVLFRLGAADWSENCAFSTTSSTELTSINGALSTTFSGWCVSASYAGNGGAFNLWNTDGADLTVTLENCRFESCRAEGETNGGGAVHTRQVKVIVTSCEFNRCFAGKNGGAIQVKVNTQVTVQQSVFRACTSTLNGGAVSVANDLDNMPDQPPHEHITFTDCEFYDCGPKSGENKGSALWLSDISDLTFTGNIFDGVTDTTTSVVDVTFYELRESELLIEDCQFSQKTQLTETVTTGFVLFANVKKIKYNNVSFTGISSSTGGGAGIVANTPVVSLTLEVCNFTRLSCAASSAGTAIVAGSLTDASFKTCTFDSCSVGTDGSIVSVSCHALTAEQLTFHRTNEQSTGIDLSVTLTTELGSAEIRQCCFSGGSDSLTAYVKLTGTGSATFTDTCFDLEKDKSISVLESVSVTYADDQEDFIFGQCGCDPFEDARPTATSDEDPTTISEDEDDGGETSSATEDEDDGGETSSATEEEDQNNSAEEGDTNTAEGSDGNGDTGAGDDGNGDSDVPKIVGGVIGGLVGVALVVGLIVFFVLRRRKRADTMSDSVGDDLDATGSSFAETVELSGETDSAANTNVSPLFQGAKDAMHNDFSDVFEEARSDSA